MLNFEEKEIEALKDYIRVLEKRVAELEAMSLPTKEFEQRVQYIFHRMIRDRAAANS
jgi:hypothetical protein